MGWGGGKRRKNLLCYIQHSTTEGAVQLTLEYSVMRQWWLETDHHAAFFSQSSVVVQKEAEWAFRRRQGSETDVQCMNVRHTHLHHRSTWVWWAAAWQHCTSSSPPHTTPQRLPWEPGPWSTCPWIHTEKHTHAHTEKMSRLSHFAWVEQRARDPCFKESTTKWESHSLLCV